MGFLVVVFGVVFAVHYYLYRRLIRSTTLPGRARRALTGGLIVLLGLLLVALVGSRVSSSWVVHVLAWPGFIWVAVMFYLTLICLVLEIPRLILNRRFKGDPVKEAPPPKVVPATVGSTFGPKKIEIEVEDVVEPPERPDRRLFINRAAAVAAGIGAGTIVGFGLKSGLGAPVIEKVRISLPGFAGGMRVALVSDIHLGPLTGIGHTERIVELINTLKADFVAIVGDLVDGPVSELGPLAAPLQHIRPQTYFVTGNHEYYLADGPEPWIDLLGGYGIKTLVNERVTIQGQHGNLTLAGVNDVTGDTVRHGPDLELALHGRPEGVPTILLAHQPVIGLEAAKAGVDLQLSGHTHGGQMVPFDRIVPLQQPVVRGLGKIGDMPIYVTRGAGFWGPPVRVGAPPEITLIELT
ncbi:metallophosphoesterase [Herbidospora sp. NBRC 101105]|uniref:metallophosphoesterase n=1 Tax=Herbidospora sp. NBRC 101105 TaxID=3032195 RepID=UPI00249F97F9|nr:metallophosphoesterase [Herbidospora sp. NBRC 101105]GLX95058.1 metallophosphatase [Herbidospora sp. NBRC 101105]